MTETKVWIEEGDTMRLILRLEAGKGAIVEKQLETILQRQGSCSHRFHGNEKPVYVVEVDRQKNDQHAGAHGVLPLGPDEVQFPSALAASRRLGLSYPQVAMSLGAVKRLPNPRAKHINAAKVGGVVWRYVEDKPAV